DFGNHDDKEPEENRGQVQLRPGVERDARDREMRARVAVLGIDDPHPREFTEQDGPADEAKTCGVGRDERRLLSGQRAQEVAKLDEHGGDEYEDADERETVGTDEPPAARRNLDRTLDAINAGGARRGRAPRLTELESAGGAAAERLVRRVHGERHRGGHDDRQPYPWHGEQDADADERRERRENPGGGDEEVDKRGDGRPADRAHA